VVEDSAYATGDGHSKAVAAILTKMQMSDAVRVLLKAGLYDATRRAAPATDR
jgi:hypothetical protein